MPLLPNELVASIIEELYDDDDSQASIHTLKNCALVARAWVHASQRRIFRCIIFWFVGGDSRLDQLISLFDANPPLATYVKRLELNGYGEHCKPADNWERAVNRLSNLGAIKLFYSRLISPVLKETPLGMLRCPSLTKVIFDFLRIDRFADFTALLSNLTRLKSLEISSLQCHNWSMLGSGENLIASHPLPLPRSIQLTELDLNDVHEQLLAWFQQDSCPFGYQNLRTLRLTNDGGLMLNSDIVQYAGKSLRELELGGSSADVQNMDAVHLGYVPNLRSLTLSYLEQTAWHTPVPWIESLFMPVVNPTQQYHPLQSLTIHLSDFRNGFNDPSDLLHTQNWDKWTGIDSILEKKVFAALEEVTFRYYCLAWRDIDSEKEKELKEKLKKLLHRVLPFLAGSGKLRVVL